VGCSAVRSHSSLRRRTRATDAREPAQPRRRGARATNAGSRPWTPARRSEPESGGFAGNGDHTPLHCPRERCACFALRSNGKSQRGSRHLGQSAAPNSCQWAGPPCPARSPTDSLLRPTVVRARDQIVSALRWTRPADRRQRKERD
jgi:hypothetical protein